MDPLHTLRLQEIENVSFTGAPIGIYPSTIIFGRNGTGKSSITEAVQTQCDDRYCVEKFTGIQSVVDKDLKLNAIALGKENVETKAKIDELTEKADSLHDDIETGQSFKEFSKAQTAHENANKSLQEALTDIARTIKELDSPRLVSISYNRANLEKDLEDDPQVLEEASRQRYIQQANGKELETPNLEPFPSVNLVQIFRDTNELLEAPIRQFVPIPELDGNDEKRQFAERGVEIHKREEGERCAFCNNTITEDRWEQLEEYFSAASKNLKDRIEKELDTLNKLEAELKEYSDSLTLEGIYPDYRDTFGEIRDRIVEYSNSVSSDLDSARCRLQERLKNIFHVVAPIKINQSRAQADEIQLQLESLLRKNREHTSKLKALSDQAKQKLLEDKIASLVKEFKVQDLRKDESQKKSALDKAQGDLESLQEEEASLRRQIADLRSNMMSEEIAVSEINKVLKAYCSVPFELVRAEAHGQGFYNISDTKTHMNRSVTELSTGEVNLISFLYFVSRLKRPSDDGKKRIAIFDDPMTSNDTTYQFIILSTLNQLFDQVNPKKQEKTSTLASVVVLTHNIHFYLNLVPYGTRKFTKSMGVYLLNKNYRTTDIKRVQGKDDNIKSSYDALWQDLGFAYHNERPNLMWNTFRRIVGSYLIFNGCNANNVVETEADHEKVLGQILKKSMDVSSHEILDFEAESSNTTVEEIKQYVFDFFDRRGNPEHFEHYWPTETED